MTFDFIWFSVCTKQYLTVRRDLAFAVLNFELNLDVKE